MYIKQPSVKRPIHNLKHNNYFNRRPTDNPIHMYRNRKFLSTRQFHNQSSCTYHERMLTQSNVKPINVMYQYRSGHMSNRIPIAFRLLHTIALSAR